MGCHDSGDEFEKPNLETVAALNQIDLPGGLPGGMIKHMSGPTDYILTKNTSQWGTVVETVTYGVMHSRPTPIDEMMPDYTVFWRVSGVASFSKPSINPPPCWRRRKW